MYQDCLKLVFKSVSRVVKGSFMGVSIAFVFIEVIEATRAYGGLVNNMSQPCNTFVLTFRHHNTFQFLEMSE